MVNYSSLGAPLAMNHVTAQKYTDIFEQVYIAHDTMGDIIESPTQGAAMSRACLEAQSVVFFRCSFAWARFLCASSNQTAEASIALLKYSCASL
jgi:hypothetical protein